MGIENFAQLLESVLADNRQAMMRWKQYVRARAFSPDNIQASLNRIQQSLAENPQNSQAIFLRASMYHDGLGEKNFQKAIFLDEQAIPLGNANAMNNRAFMHAHGQGGEQNYAAAIDLYDEAIRLGNAHAMNNRAFMHMYGQGGKQDYATAIVLYDEAIRLGNDDAMANRASMYVRGEGEEQNYAAAISLYEQAIQLGDARAMHDRAFMHQHGQGGAKNIEAAVELYYQAIQHGSKDIARKVLNCLTNIHHWRACYYLVLMSITGRGMDQNLGRAQQTITESPDKDKAKIVDSLYEEILQRLDNPQENPEQLNHLIQFINNNDPRLDMYGQRAQIQRTSLLIKVRDEKALECYYNNHSLDEMIADCQQIIDSTLYFKNGTSSRYFHDALFLRRGTLYLLKGSLDQALKDLHFLIENNATILDRVYDRRGDLYLQQGQLALARDYFSSAMACQNSNIQDQLWYKLKKAWVLAEMNQIEEAINLCEEAQNGQETYDQNKVFALIQLLSLYQEKCEFEKIGNIIEKMQLLSVSLLGQYDQLLLRYQAVLLLAIMKLLSRFEKELFENINDLCRSVLNNFLLIPFSLQKVIVESLFERGLSERSLADTNFTENYQTELGRLVAVKRHEDRHTPDVTERMLEIIGSFSDETKQTKMLWHAFHPGSLLGQVFYNMTLEKIGFFRTKNILFITNIYKDTKRALVLQNLAKTLEAKEKKIRDETLEDWMKQDLILLFFQKGSEEKGKRYLSKHFPAICESLGISEKPKNPSSSSLSSRNMFQSTLPKITTKTEVETAEEYHSTL